MAVLRAAAAAAAAAADNDETAMASYSEPSTDVILPTVAAAEATTISSFNPQTRRTRWRSSCENEEKEWRVGGVREKLRG